MSNLDQDGYTGEQRQHLDQAKRKHRETTASAQRALQVCWLQARESGNTASNVHLFASCIAAVPWHVFALVLGRSRSTRGELRRNLQKLDSPLLY